MLDNLGVVVSEMLLFLFNQINYSDFRKTPCTGLEYYTLEPFQRDSTQILCTVTPLMVPPTGLAGLGLSTAKFVAIDGLAGLSLAAPMGGSRRNLGGLN